MEQKIKSLLSRIYSDINRNTKPDPSLLSGNAGILLFDYLYSEASHKAESEGNESEGRKSEGSESERKHKAESERSHKVVSEEYSKAGSEASLKAEPEGSESEGSKSERSQKADWKENDKAEKDSRIDNDAFQNDFELLAEHSLSFSHPTFCSGYAGINWYFKFLQAKELLSDEDREILCYRDKELERISLEMLKHGNYDFLHGAVGIAYYLLYRPAASTEEYYAAFFQLLEALIDASETRDAVPNFDYKTNSIIPGEINLGLSHGIPSVLKFCIQSYKQGICTEKSEKLARQLIDYLLTHTNADTTSSYFPYTITISSSERRIDEVSRLAWCYGDAGAGIILYHAGVAFQDKPTIDFSLKVLLNSTKRKNTEEAMIKDACICHGTAGIAHIYNKMWHYTQDPAFKDACDYWIQKTLGLGVYPDGIAGFKKYTGVSNKYENDSGLLEGAAGIGLALLSYLTGDFSWDYCLMLND